MYEEFTRLARESPPPFAPTRRSLRNVPFHRPRVAPCTHLALALRMLRSVLRFTGRFLVTTCPMSSIAAHNVTCHQATPPETCNIA